MKTKYSSVSIYATQGGGEAVREGNGYIFIVPPDWHPNPCSFKAGDDVPEEWGIQYMYERYTLEPTPPRKNESRSQREGSHQKRHSYWNRKRVINRQIKKTAKLSYKGTLRSITKSQMNKIMHRVGVDMARKERQEAHKNNKVVHFYEGDELRVVSIEGYENHLQLKDICIMDQQNSEPRNMIVVTNRRTKEMKLFRKDRFVLHKRFIENE